MNRRKPETERRKWARLPLAIPIFVRSTDESGQEFLEFASALNISAGGALIAVRRCPPLCSTVSLEIPNAPLASVASPTANSQKIKAVAMRVDHAEDYHLIALRFLTPVPTDSDLPVAPRRKAASPRVKSFSLSDMGK